MCGSDPVERQREQRRKAKEERQKQEAAATTTLKDICEEYLTREGGMTRDAEGSATFAVERMLRSALERLAVFERVVYPDNIAGQQIEDVRRSDISKLLDKVEGERGKQSAQHLLAFPSPVFACYAARHNDFCSPIVRGMGRVKPRERAGKRTLIEELRDLWATRPWGNVTQVASDEGLLVEEVIAQFLLGERRARWRPLEGKLFQPISPDDFPNELRTPVVIRVGAGPKLGDMGWIAQGSRIEITLTMSSIITVAASGLTLPDTPRMPTVHLISGDVANHVGGTGTNTLRFEFTLDDPTFANAETLKCFRIVRIDPHGATIRDVAGEEANLAGAIASRLSPHFNVSTGKLWFDIPATIEPPTCFDLGEGSIYADGRLCGKDVEFERRSNRVEAYQPSTESIPDANSFSTATRPRTLKSKGGAPLRHDWEEGIAYVQSLWKDRGDRAARLAVIPAGESPANRGVQLLL
jgi:hypothetical protein